MFHVEQYNYLPIKTIKTETSEGEIPLIRDACPIVVGLIVVNLSTASPDKELNEE